MTGMTLDKLAEECEKMFDTEHSEHLDELFRLEILYSWKKVKMENW
ncbi:MAG: hypothetical protein PHY47_18065 [Lachnospiraceae bacterium]|nr:hypothetical protein [Lachnospiraceae bacterium]